MNEYFIADCLKGSFIETFYFLQHEIKTVLHDKVIKMLTLLSYVLSLFLNKDKVW